MIYEICTETDPGLARENNEDAVAFVPTAHRSAHCHPLAFRAVTRPQGHCSALARDQEDCHTRKLHLI